MTAVLKVSGWFDGVQIIARYEAGIDWPRSFQIFSVAEFWWTGFLRLHRTHERLIAGEVFRVSETFEGADGTLYLKLADGRGWVFESKAGIGTLCVRCQSDSVARLQDDEPLYGYGERKQSPDMRNNHNYELYASNYGDD